MLLLSTDPEPGSHKLYTLGWGSQMPIGVFDWATQKPNGAGDEVSCQIKTRKKMLITYRLG